MLNIFQMNENRYFKGRDLRAVENPYDAAFELAGSVNKFSSGALQKVKVLIGIFIYYIIIILGVIYFNLFFGKNWNLVIFSIIFSFVMLIITIIVEKWLIASYRFFQDLQANHQLLIKIEYLPDENFNEIKAAKKQKIKENPMVGLLELISVTSDHSKKISKTLKFVIGFISLWYLAGIIYLSIQTYRFGIDANSWEFDWLLPGGIDLVIAILATALILILNGQFDFIHARYTSIDYALRSQSLTIPNARTPIDSYVKYLSSNQNYKYLNNKALWKKGKYFDLEVETKKGMILLKYLKRIPQLVDVKKLKDHVNQHYSNRQLNLVILLFKESLTEPLPDDLYNYVIENPIKFDNKICNIQLVIECNDGKYDFIPIISF